VRASVTATEIVAMVGAGDLLVRVQNDGAGA
jgi:hypothetical protein